LKRKRFEILDHKIHANVLPSYSSLALFSGNNGILCFEWSARSKDPLLLSAYPHRSTTTISTPQTNRRNYKPLYQTKDYHPHVNNFILKRKPLFVETMLTLERELIKKRNQQMDGTHWMKFSTFKLIPPSLFLSPRFNLFDKWLTNRGIQILPYFG